jgi:hypothetical protein
MKLEDVYGYLAINLEKGRKEFTQKEASSRLGGSISSVHYAIEPLKRIGSITKRSRGFEVIDPKKFLVYWASVHRMRVSYCTHYPEPAEEIETLMPPVLFTAYSGAKFYYGIAPADYGEVYAYGDEKEVEKRFPRREGLENVFCLKPPFFLREASKTPLSLLYVDLWNIATWYAREYLKEVEARLDELLE